MPVRIRAALTAGLVVAASFLATATTASPVAAAGEKVAIIVGPVGSMTNGYRSAANGVANAAAAAGAVPVTVYSPNATWANVQAAVNGANVIVYFGHGNGYPNPYGSTELTDRTNGWGLNRTTTNGDGDSWSSTLAYCGEKALLGTLTGSDGAVQRTYCGGSTDTDGISPAPGFTMIYAQAHYTGGWGERYSPSDPLTTLDEAQQRVRNYSYPVLALGARGYFATGLGDAAQILTRVLTQPNSTMGGIFFQGGGFDQSALMAIPHADILGAEVWVQETVAGSMHFGQPDYWYAFAGNPSATPASGGTPLPFNDIGASPFIADIAWIAAQGITLGCGGGSYCPTVTVNREQMASFIGRARSLPAATQDYFPDDAGSLHEADINRLAAAGISNGCGGGLYCPGQAVTRDQMASFLARALALPAAGYDYFPDDAGSLHEADINRLAAAGISNGCGGGLYCPSHAVTREQMAAFLHRALD
ncbi:MAG: S-layer homology domain-containing protein [Chloroflexi bacterium]|nr:S-layer homology domain-containing protein [Chloroflexota bacterium]